MDDADLALLRIRALALFEQAPARNLVLDQFSKDAESHTVDSLKSPIPESFVAAFEDTKTEIFLRTDSVVCPNVNDAEITRRECNAAIETASPLHELYPRQRRTRERHTRGGQAALFGFAAGYCAGYLAATRDLSLLR